MKKLQILIVILISIVILASCDEEDKIDLSSEDFLVFGHFYGECLGESCVEIYKLEDDKLLEDILDNYPGQQDFYTGNFVHLEEDKYLLVNDLMDYFPDDLLDEEKITHGCPDCADQGGLYIEYNSNEIHKYWILDQSKSEVPDYLQGK
jgi:hypothetical protein